MQKICKGSPNFKSKPHTVPITNQLMRSVALARQNYHKSLEDKKNDREKGNCSNEKRR